jgi:hypothetical protein
VSGGFIGSSSLMEVDGSGWKHKSVDTRGREEMGSTLEFSKFAAYFNTQRAF